MLRFGNEPFLECSSKGDKRFSAFYARIKQYDNKSIEELYQAHKIFPDNITGLTPREAKGKQALNMDDCNKYYSHLWDVYFQENPDLLLVIKSYSGFSDIFGQQGHCCQAEEIYRIWQSKRGRTMPFERYIFGNLVRDGDDECMVIKTHVYNDDKTITPKLKFVVNPKRKYWVTIPSRRDHPFKKEYEKKENLLEFTAENRHLAQAIERSLAGPDGYVPRRNFLRLKDVTANPYVYGVDISIEALIKHAMDTKFKVYPDPPKPLTTGFLDIETHMESGKMVCISVVHETKVYTAIYRPFLKKKLGGKMVDATIEDIDKLFKEQCELYELEYRKKPCNAATFGFKAEYFVSDDEVSMIRWIMDSVHKNKTDVIGVWNINFDIPRILSILEANGVDPRDIFCSPDVPRRWKYVNFREDTKVTDHISKKWHWFTTSGYTQFIDSMCLYSYVRISAGKETSYALDDILRKEIKAGKLKFKHLSEQLNDLSSADWHRYMQTNHPVEYIVYNQFDCISVQIMNWQTDDIQLMHFQSEYTPISAYPRQTRRVCESFHFYCLDNGHVLGSTGKTARTEFDNMINLDGGAVLPPYMTKDCGMNILEDYKRIETMLTVYVMDADLSSSYPTIIDCCNVSKTTKVSTCLSIDKGSLQHARNYYGLLAAMLENSVMIGHAYYGLPDYTEMEDMLLAS